jgi:PAS domain S-box-containing protein
MLSFFRQRVGAKLILIYAVALLLMVTIAFVAVVRLNQISSTVSELTDTLAVEKGLAQELVSQTWLVRFHANKYVQTQNQSDLDNFYAEYDQLENLLAQADQITTNPERQQKLESIRSSVREYGDAFEQVTQLIKRRQTIQSNTLDVNSLIVENELTALRVSLNNSNEPQVFLALGNIQSGFEKMRLNVVNYLATNDEGYVVLFNSSYQDATSAFSNLESMSNVSQSQGIADAEQAIQAYYEGFQTIQSDNVQLKQLFSDQLEVLEPQISLAAQEIVTSVEQELAAKNESSHRLVAGTRAVIAVTTLSAILVVLGLGFVLSRQITAPLQRVMQTSQQIADVDLQALTTQLEKLASGDLNLNLDVSAEPLIVTTEDEVGQMAEAFNAIIDRLHQAGQAFKEMSAYLNRMADTATMVAQGELDGEVAVQSQEDVLGHALANMVADLRKTHRELQEHQQHLESLVKERTFQLEHEKQFLEALIQNSPVAIAVTGLDNSIFSWNPAAEKLYGYTEDEVINRNLDDVIASEEQQTEAVAYTRQILKGASLIHAVTQRKRKDGSLVDVEMLGVPVIVEGERAGGLAIYHDITELQHARREAEQASHAKSAFLAVMSHEIRTPMNAIIGMTSLLLDTPLGAEQYEFVETIRQSGETLLTIINDILDFSKIEAGKMELEEQPFYLHECIESALDLVVAQARDKQLELVYMVEPQVPAILNGDVTRLRQVLLNLLSNAIKFTHEGEVVVSVSLAESSSTLPYTLQFSVRDTGIGIPEDRIGSLFQSFSQVDASTTRKYGGTGLGLAISKRLVELMGGTMWVESTEGEGSTFLFTMQAAAAPAQARVYLRRDQPKLQDQHVLIVDDNETNRRVLMAQTRAWRMLPRATGSPQEALDWVKRGDPFDVILLDMQMPEKDGVTLAGEIREWLDGKPLPIVMLSSLDRWDVHVDDDQLAAFLTKPIKQSVLYDTLLGIFAERTVIQQVTKPDRASKFDSHLAERLPLRILVAEDNPVNQNLANHMLRKMGYRADTASNGLEVLEALERQSYDVILMDVQMPEMDGFETTRQIHQRWPDASPRIVAITANAMQGDREECLQAGMDDYVSKPIQVEELQLALERRGEQQVEESVPVEVPPVDPSLTTLDWSVLDGLRALQEAGEPDFVQETIDLYLADAPQQIEAIQQAIAQNRPDELRHAAHTLKGNSRSLGAMKLGTLSFELEKIGKSGTIEGAESLLTKLKQEFERVKEALSLINDR